MKVPDALSEHVGVAIQLERLWRKFPAARLTVEPEQEGAYRVSVTVPDGPGATAHSSSGVHAMSRAFTHLGLANDLTDYP